MQRTVISHDIEAATARVKFEHEGVIVEDTFDLAAVVPSTRHVFAQMGLEFDETHQLTALDRLEESIERQIDAGMITART
mgnify:CR=1 FL=1